MPILILFGQLVHITRMGAIPYRLQAATFNASIYQT